MATTEFEAEAQAASSLEELLEVLRAEDARHRALNGAERDADPEADLTDLPVYGGDEPGDTSGVWSWDAKRLLVGSCISEMRIVRRDEWET